MSRGMRRDPQQQRQQQQMITRWTRFLCVSGSSADIRLLIMCCCVCRWCSMRSSPSRTCSRPAQWCTGELLGIAIAIGPSKKSNPKPWFFRCNITQCDSPDSLYEEPWLNFTIPYKNSDWDMCNRYMNTTPLELAPLVDMCSAEYFVNTSIVSCGNDFKFRDQEETISTEVSTHIRSHTS